MEDLMGRVGEKLKEAREEAFLSQRKVAELLGYSSSSMSRWENGFDCIPLPALSQLCNIYGITLSQFFSRVER